MQFWFYLFLISCFLIFYNYAGYAVIVFILNKLTAKKKSTVGEAPLPTISFIVAAFNEEDCIRQKIHNTLEQDYPADKIEFLFVTDGSSDRTPEIIAEYPAIKLLHQEGRKGKPSAMNRGITQATGNVLIFSDANTLLNKDAIRNIARHYNDPATGGVAGEKKVLTGTSGNQEVGAGEGFYWKYESFLKKLDAEFYSVVGAAGELFSVRRDLYEPVSDGAILDDFVISLTVASKGYRIQYEPQAIASELPSSSIRDEKKRKVRIAAGGFQSIVMLRKLLIFWRSPRLSFLYISHRVLRWAVTPFCLPVAFISNGMLIQHHAPFIFTLLFILQIVFYGMAFLAKWLPYFGKRKLFKFPYYFVFMNISVIYGFFRFLKGGQSILWEKAKREVAQP